MSKFDDVVAKCEAHLEKIGSFDADLLRKVTKGLGPSVYKADASKVAASDKEELARVKQNFLIKKLGLDDSSKLDDAIAGVCEQYTERAKHRPVFYYLLVKALGQEKAYE